MNTEKLNSETPNNELSTAEVTAAFDAATAPKKADPSDAPDTPTDYFAGLDADVDLSAADVFDADALPPYDFAVAPHVVLKDGTEFTFAIPDLASERRADNLRKTLILTSPARINGFNPTQETTDYATADWRYFLDNLRKVKGFALTADADPNEELDARQVVRTDKGADGKETAVTVAHLIPAKHARAAVARIYGGKIEVEKPEGDTAARVLVLNETRYVTVKQEFGVEQNDDGTFSNPTHIVRYVFREPTSRELAYWQTKCFLGYKIPIKGGGAREERYFNTDKTVELFDKLIERVERAVYDGVPIATDAAGLTRIPDGVKRTAITIAMGEVSGDVGK